MQRYINIIKRDQELQNVIMAFQLAVLDAIPSARFKKNSVELHVTLDDFTLITGAITKGGIIDVGAFEEKNSERNPSKCLHYFISYLLNDFGIELKHENEVAEAVICVIYQTVRGVIELGMKQAA